MDNLTLIHIWQIFRVAAHAVTATYLTYLVFKRGRDQWLYASLAIQFAFVVVWSGIGVFNPSLEPILRPWQTWPVLLTLIVVIRDFAESCSPKARAMRSIEQKLSVEVGNAG